MSMAAGAINENLNRQGFQATMPIQLIEYNIQK